MKNIDEYEVFQKRGITISVIGGIAWLFLIMTIAMEIVESVKGYDLAMYAFFCLLISAYAGFYILAEINTADKSHWFKKR